MLKNDFLSRSLSLDEIVEYSGIQGTFRAFALAHLRNSMGYPIADEETMVPALQVAAEKLTLTDQVLCVLRELGIPVVGSDGLSIIYGDGKSVPQRKYDQIVQPCIKALGAQEWPDKALEFFDYLITNANYPVAHWDLLFNNYENIDFRNTPVSEGKKSASTVKSVEQHISEGLFRHIDGQHLSSSPYSIKFWFNKQIWSTQEDSEARHEDIKYCEAMCGRLAYAWYSGLIQRDKREQAETFLKWLNRTGNDKYLTESSIADIATSKYSTPVLAPSEAVGLSEEETIRIWVNALWQNAWETREGQISYPTDDEKKVIYAGLTDAAQRCSEDKLKLPHDLVRELIFVDNWAPTGFVRLSSVTPYAIALSVKLLALMRSRLIYEKEEFDVYDYRNALDNIVHCGNQPEKALKQLLITMRQCSAPCSDESLNFKPTLTIHGSADLPIEEPFEGRSPYECVSCLIHMVLSSLGDKRKLCLSLSEYCLSRVKTRKGEKGEFDKAAGYYDNKLCMEPDPIWRRAYIQALGELGYDLDGQIHKALDFIKNHDPDKQVRAEAKRAHKAVKRETNKELDDRKGLLAAFFWLRWAQRESLGAEINQGRAMLTRRGELRGDVKHNADYLYNNYL